MTNTLWPVEYCARVGVNLFSMTCELVQGSKLSSDNKNNFVLETACNEILLD